MRLTTWNVNGIRNPFSYQPWNSARSFPAMFDILETDIIVMQELKIQRKDLRDDMVILDGWDCYFSLPKHKKGYSGVGIYTRNATCAPIKAEEGLLGVLPSRGGLTYRALPEEESIGGYPSEAQVSDLQIDPIELDSEGRCVILEFSAFVLIGVYVPANSNGLRDGFRFAFIRALDQRIRNLVKAGKNVVLVGDLNVSRDERDGAAAMESRRKEGMTHEEYISTPNRRIFNQLLIDGEVVGERDEGREKGVLWDTTRAFHPDRKGMYTHWEQKVNARPGNYGSRIDFVLVSENLQSWISAADIQEGLLGSDHCPVYVDFHDHVVHKTEGQARDVSLVDIMNPPAVIETGERKIEWRVQDVPAMSGRRLPEFNKRRSIKSMFAAPLVKASSSLSVVTEAEPAAASTSGEFASPAIQPVSQASTKAESPDRKRRVPASAKATPPKRMKSDSSDVTLKGQQSLKGFFTTQPAAKASENLPSKTDSTTTITTPRHNHEDTHSTNEPGTEPDQSVNEANAALSANEPYSPASTAFTASPGSIQQSFEAREKTNRSWNALFSRPVAPLCESHAEPCKSMLTKKKGSNQGRSFWMCARPLGPSGGKERGTQWRCATFIWCSDWDAKAGSNSRERDIKDGEG